MSNKVDRRVKYTKMVLKDSLTEILEEKSIEKITVKEICEKADINRGTFYSHYSDQFDLYNSIVDELISGVFDRLGDFMVQTSVNIYSSTLDVLEFIKENNVIIKILLNGGIDYNIEKRIRSIIKGIYLDKVSDEVDIDYVNATYSYISAGCVASVRHWLNSGMKKSTEEIATFIVNITTGGLEALK